MISYSGQVGWPFPVFRFKACHFQRSDADGAQVNETKQLAEV